MSDHQIDASWIPASWLSDPWFSPLFALCANRAEVELLAEGEHLRKISRLREQSERARKAKAAAMAAPISADAIAGERQMRREDAARQASRRDHYAGLLALPLAGQQAEVNRRNAVRAADTGDGEPGSPITVEDARALWVERRDVAAAHFVRAEAAASVPDAEIERHLREYAGFQAMDRLAPDSTDYEIIDGGGFMDLAGRVLRGQVNGNRDVEDACWRAIRAQILLAPAEKRDEEAMRRYGIETLAPAGKRTRFIVRRPLAEQQYEVVGHDGSRLPFATYGDAMKAAHA